MTALTDILRLDSAQTIAGAPEGFDALVLADLARAANGPILHIARDDARMAALAEALAFFAPGLAVAQIPGWDCLPYDRVGPNGAITAARMSALAHLAQNPDAARIVLTSVNAALQRIPPRDFLMQAGYDLRKGGAVDIDALARFLASEGYNRVSTVMEPGDFAVRGGIVDLYAPDSDGPIRLDFFGDVLEDIRDFDPLSQRTTGARDQVTLIPVGEAPLTQDSIRRFRRAYTELFGAAGRGAVNSNDSGGFAVVRDDPLYASISEGRKPQGAEHWTPLFHSHMDSLFDLLPNATVILDHLADEAAAARLATIEDYYAARKTLQQNAKGAEAANVYKPLPPAMLYLTAAEWGARNLHRLSPYHATEAAAQIDAGGRTGRDFAPERAADANTVFSALKDHIQALNDDRKKVIIACYSLGSRERVAHVLKDHGILASAMVEDWAAFTRQPHRTVSLIVLGLEHGFVADNFALVTEQDILGDRLVRKSRRSKRAENFLSEAAALTPGDLVVHVDHGVGRYEGLQTITVSGAPHDCVLLVYDGGDKLFVPVENIDVLSRYGSDNADAQLDKLGGAGWQSRKARLKKRIRDIADHLIKIAAERLLREGEMLHAPEGLYDEFCARFPYAETEDQLRAISDVMDDMASGRPMDRLVCGDVGFGKTEVALRSAFVAAMAGKQVAVVTPTTLLCRQHYKTFSGRFAGLPLRVAHLSRLVGAKEQAAVKKGLADGTIDIVVGTHALLGKAIGFKDLGLLIIDEEQHFGVTHKERLKELRSDVHVLTLTATPIPRTLQQAMSGIRDLSLITTPPIDRLAVRTFVLPVDPVVLREAILREHYRGGQSFYVVPRIADLPEVADFLKEHVPEVKVAIAHGQMAPGQLDDIMNAFYDGAYNILLSTTIIESGLDIPTANTLIVHRADMFGLAQLYQLRGRVGRSKLRAYCYLTLPPGKTPTGNAEKRLQVLQALDTLGAGFTLASHDMDIRGAGNLLGEEQSGHVREVGIELYQQMLEEAVAVARQGGTDAAAIDNWSPQINIGASVLIPESYVPDLNLRMALYRRVAHVTDIGEIDSFAAELIDRFGPLPDEVSHLLRIVAIKALCRAANIEKVEAGPKGVTLSFRGDRFPNPPGLIDWLSKQKGMAKLRPDHKLVLARAWDRVSERLDGSYATVAALAKIAGAQEPAS